MRFRLDTEACGQYGLKMQSKAFGHSAAWCAGYHSAALYHALRGAIQPLTELLTDDEYKTRANAAGALGNLVRNSGMLCAPIVQAHALQVTLGCASAKLSTHSGEKCGSAPVPTCLHAGIACFRPQKVCTAGC